MRFHWAAVGVSNNGILYKQTSNAFILLERNSFSMCARAFTHGMSWLPVLSIWFRAQNWRSKFNDMSRCTHTHTHITFIQSNIFNENFNIMIDSHWTLNAIERYWINKLTLFIDSIFNKLKFPQPFHIEWSTFTTTTCTSSYFQTSFNFSIRKKMNRHFLREHLPFDSNKNEKSFSNYSCKRFITLE